MRVWTLPISSLPLDFLVLSACSYTAGNTTATARSIYRDTESPPFLGSLFLSLTNILPPKPPKPPLK
jgi:hypothetical protein